jgi:hypothetical protein
MAAEAQPGSTITREMLPIQFHDPNKVRHKTIYQKSFCHPEFERSRGTRVGGGQTCAPRITAMTECWDPGWRNDR